ASWACLRQAGFSRTCLTRATPSGVEDRATTGSCWVALGGYPPRAPTDPDVQISRIRLVRSTVHTRRYTEGTTRAAGSGIRSSSPHRLPHPRRPSQLRRASHFRHTRATIPRLRFNEEQFPVTP